MGGKKVKLAFIINDSARKATYKKRVKSFLKKLSEITTLCDIQACALVYNPDDPQQAKIWPSTQGLHDVLIRYLRFPEIERNRKTMNHETYLKERIAKTNDKIKKVASENRRQEANILMYRYLETRKLPENLSVADAGDLTNVVDMKLKEIEKRLEELNVVKSESAM